MPKLTDPNTIRAISLAFEEAADGCKGYVNWKPIAVENLARHFPGLTPALIEELIAIHLESNGEINCVQERRPEWRDRHRYHYDFVLANPQGGIALYVETVVVNDDLEDASILIVNCHPAD